MFKKLTRFLSNNCCCQQDQYVDDFYFNDDMSYNLIDDTDGICLYNELNECKHEINNLTGLLKQANSLILQYEEQINKMENG